MKSDLFRVRTEINSLKELRHENIAKLMQIIETDTDIYLVMEVTVLGVDCVFIDLSSSIAVVENSSIIWWRSRDCQKTRPEL